MDNLAINSFSSSSCSSAVFLAYFLCKYASNAASSATIAGSGTFGHLASSRRSAIKQDSSGLRVFLPLIDDIRKRKSSCPFVPIEDSHHVAMATSCTAPREDLIQCVKKSECMVKDEKKFEDCLDLAHKNDASVGEECHKLLQAFFECKRSQVCANLVICC